VPLPKAPPKPLPEQQPGPGTGPGAMPGGILPGEPADGGIFPPEPGFGPTRRPPTTPKGEPDVEDPLLKGGLPGLPDTIEMPPESEIPGGIPGMPEPEDSLRPKDETPPIPGIPEEKKKKPSSDDSAIGPELPKLVPDAMTAQPALLPEPGFPEESEPAVEPGGPGTPERLAKFEPAAEPEPETFEEPAIEQTPKLLEEPATAEETKIYEDPRAPKAPVVPDTPAVSALNGQGPFWPPPLVAAEQAVGWETPKVARVPVETRPPSEPPAPDAPVADPSPPRGEAPQPKTLQANWMAALHPGFRGQVGPPLNSYSSTGSGPLAAGIGSPGSHTAETLQKTRTEPTPSLPQKEPKLLQQSVVPSIAMDGYCPVELAKSEQWVEGDPRLKVEHRGQAYLCSSPANRRRFLADPNRYVPACSGNDPVLLVDEKRGAAGGTDYCVTYDGRLYMFDSQDTLEKFESNPRRYTAAMARMRTKIR